VGLDEIDKAKDYHWLHVLKAAIAPWSAPEDVVAIDALVGRRSWHGGCHWAYGLVGSEECTKRVAWLSGWGVYGVPARTLGGRAARRWGGGLRRCDGDRQSMKLAKGHNVYKALQGAIDAYST
jgi:hypothetical protein